MCKTRNFVRRSHRFGSAVFWSIAGLPCAWAGEINASEPARPQSESRAKPASAVDPRRSARSKERIGVDWVMAEILG